MTADNFVKIVRKGSDKLRVDDINLSRGEQTIHGKGMMRISREEIELDLTFDAGQSPPPQEFGVRTQSDYWKLTGIIEDVLRFKCDYVGGGSQSQFINWETRKTMLTVDLSPIDLIPSGYDALTREERDQLQREHRERHNLPPPHSVHTAEATQSVYFYAQILNYPIPTLVCKGTNVVTTNPYLGERQSGQLDTIMGELDGYKYAFIKQKDSGDLHVHLESKGGKATTEEEDWSTFYALMHALAFTQGIHAWPYRIEYWRNGPKLSDKVTPARRLAKTFHVPFHLANFDFQNVINKATAFFKTDSLLQREVTNLLFLFREAGDHDQVHGEITLISLCVLFESLVNQMFRELKLEEKARQNGIAKPNMRERLRAVTGHFGFPWENDMEIIFNTWRTVRNPLIHGDTRTNQSEGQSVSSMNAGSVIAGAFNILVLKLIGFSGKMCASVFEQNYRQI